MAGDLIVDIIEALSRADQVPSEELGYHLHEYIDADSLEALAHHEGTTWELTFEVPGHEVEVTSEGSVFVDGAPFEPEASRSSRGER